jgi:HlyD family secretion protein
VSRRWLVILAVLIAAAAGSLWWMKSSEPLQFVTVPAAKGDVARSIIATGTVNPVVTVQVGSYVSGVITSLHCDFNTEVKAGQLCAKIDPRPYQMTVDQAKANLASARAQLLKDQASLAYAKTNYERDRGLLKRGIVSQDTVDSDKSAYDQGLAQVKLDEATIMQRQAALEAAQVNLDYTDIVSPVDGTVVLRNVDVGQTVAASFQTPTLFLIAKDLTKMQVDTNVSETDVGGARVGQDASFTVEAYPNKRFHGKVAQIRQAPITVQNVVTYDVVISVDNPKLLLFPGMTANVRIVTDDRKDVLKVPLQALRFEPKRLSPEGGANETPRQTGNRVWVLRGGRPVPVAVTVGIDDGTSAEITGGNLEPGERVIVDQGSGPGQRGGGGQPSRSPFRF